MNLFHLTAAFLFYFGGGVLLADPLPQALMFGNKPLEAYCLGKVMMGDAPVNLAQCHDDLEKNPIKKSINDTYAHKGFYGYTYEITYDKIPSREFCYWKYLGTPFQGQYLIYSVFNGGGSGVFSSLNLLKRKGDVLEVARPLEGGDRAGGSISDPVFKANKLTYKKALTPAGLFALGEVSKGKKSSLPLADLSDCALCCTAHAVFETNFKTTTLMKIILQRPEGEPPKKKALQETFDSVLADYIARGKTELSPQDLQEFIEKVSATYANQTF